jgi:hypothetical protein
MRRAFITVMVVLSLIAIPEAVHADVELAWFSSQQYSGPVGSLVPVIATFEGNTISLGARMPVVIVPNQFSTQQSSSCRAQRKFMSNTSPVEFTDCHLRQSPSDATSMAVTSVLPNVGQYEAYLVEMTIMLLVTDAAIPGMSYDVTAPGTFAASINVLPREDLHGSGGGESEPRNQSSPKGISVDGFEGRVRAGQSLFFSIPYDAPLRTSVYDVAIYAQTGIIDQVSSSHIVQSVAICGLGEGKGVSLAPERQSTQSTLPQTFRLTLARSIPEGTMISVCVQVSYLYNDEELSRDYFYSMLSVQS